MGRPKSQSLKKIVLPEILSPPLEAELPKVAKAPATTPKRRRMASVLDDVIATTRALTPAPIKKVAEAATAHTETEARPSVAREMKPTVTEERAEQESLNIGIAMGKEVAEKLNLLLSKHRPKILTILFDMLQEKDYPKKKFRSQTLCPGTEIPEGGLSVQRYRRR
jgi:hypothetical protein